MSSYYVSDEMLRKYKNEGKLFHFKDGDKVVMVKIAVGDWFYVERSYEDVKAILDSGPSCAAARG